MPPALLDPAVLFFVLGLLAGSVRSTLEVPPAIVRLLSLYLLMSVGLKGGFTLALTGLSATAMVALAAALFMAFLVPLLAYGLFRMATTGLQASALAATYGSVSVVTYLAAVQHLDRNGVSFDGAMTAALVIMEIPAILVGIALARRSIPAPSSPDSQSQDHGAMGLFLHGLRDGAPFLLMGSLAIGWITGEHGKAMMEPFSSALFKGMLSLFLLQMGIDVTARLNELKGTSTKLIGLAVLVPLVGAGIALALAWLLGLSTGDAALLMVLSASASYIVAPAVLRQALPDANPALYLGLSLGVTFPFNLLLGIGLYAWLAGRVMGG